MLIQVYNKPSIHLLMHQPHHGWQFRFPAKKIQKWFEKNIVFYLTKLELIRLLDSATGHPTTFLFIPKT